MIQSRGIESPIILCATTAHAAFDKVSISCSFPRFLNRLEDSVRGLWPLQNPENSLDRTEPTKVSIFLQGSTLYPCSCEEIAYFL